LTNPVSQDFCPGELIAKHQWQERRQAWKNLVTHRGQRAKSSSGRSWEGFLVDGSKHLSWISKARVSRWRRMYQEEATV
jgi:hypothetical protein